MDKCGLIMYPCDMIVKGIHEKDMVKRDERFYIFQ